MATNPSPMQQQGPPRNERVIASGTINRPQPLDAFQVSTLLANIASESSAVAERVPGARVLRAADITTLLLQRQFAQGREIEGLEVRVHAPISEFDLAEIDQFTSWNISFRTQFEGEFKTFGFSEMLDFLGKYAPDLTAQQIAGLLKPSDFVGEVPNARLTRLLSEATNIASAVRANEQHLNGDISRRERDHLLRERHMLTSARVSRLASIMQLGQEQQLGAQISVQLDETAGSGGQYIIAIDYRDGYDPRYIRTTHLDALDPLERDILAQAAAPYNNK